MEKHKTKIGGGNGKEEIAVWFTPYTQVTYTLYSGVPTTVRSKRSLLEYIHVYMYTLSLRSCQKKLGKDLNLHLTLFY